MAWSRGFGWVSRREQREADEFLAELVGRPRRSRSAAGESFPSGYQPHDLSHYEQWIANAVASEAERRPAPLGPAWVRARLLGPAKPGGLVAAATELQRIDAQRTSRTGTNYRVDTASTEHIRRAVARLLPVVERTDTSVASRSSCSRVFATTDELATRKAHWRAQIDALAGSSRSVLLDWLVGKQAFTGNATVRAATDEASAQIECLRRAANGASGRSMAGPGTLPPTRNFDDQLCIWLWKYFFRANRAGLGSICSSSAATYAFGSMTNAAVTTCQAAMSGSASHFAAGREWDPVGTGARATAHRTGWTTHLGSDDREREILQTSSAPGISRHHWGTDVDLGSTTASAWSGATYVALHQWLRTHAMAFGLVQVYTPDRPGYTTSSPLAGYDGYIEEKWHWSYYPVAQALLEWAQDGANKPLVLARLQSAWGDVRTGSTYDATRTALSWPSGTNPFGYIERHWESYVFNVNRFVTPPV